MWKGQSRVQVWNPMSNVEILKCANRRIHNPAKFVSWWNAWHQSLVSYRLLGKSFPRIKQHWNKQSILLLICVSQHMHQWKQICENFDSIVHRSLKENNERKGHPCCIEFGAFRFPVDPFSHSSLLLKIYLFLYITKGVVSYNGLKY